MTTTTRHAAPWTFARVLAMFTGPANPRRRANRPGIDHVLTGREAVARHLYGESVHWSALDMAEYDNSPYLRGGWLVEADRRIATPALSLVDLRIARWYGYTPAEWTNFPAIVKADKRESFFQARGL